MGRVVPFLFALLAPLALASCVLSPGPSAVSVPAAETLPRPESSALDDGAAGGILLWEDRLGDWCTCAPAPPLARVRAGIGLKFTWSVVDPVAADRFALFRFLVDGNALSDWGSQRRWPEKMEGDPPTFWFPDEGMHVFRVEKQLNGETTALDAVFEVVGR